MGWVRHGQDVEVTVEAYAGETFEGTVVFVEPFLDDKTRTVKVRVTALVPGFVALISRSGVESWNWSPSCVNGRMVAPDLATRGVMFKLFGIVQVRTLHRPDVHFDERHGKF